MMEDDVKKLETAVSQLLERYQAAVNENKLLRDKLQTITEEKSILLQKNDQAKNHLESMITRLKKLEQNS